MALSSSDYARVLIEQHPLDTARLLEGLEPEDAWDELLRVALPYRTAIVEEMTPDYAARVLVAANDEDRLQTVRDLPSEVAADLLDYLPDDLRASLLDALPSLHAAELSELADYEEDTAGSVMTPDFVALREGATVADALTRLRRLAMVGRNVSYVYCVSDDNVLTGVLLLRDLVVSAPKTPLSAIMIRNVFKVHVSDELSEVADVLRDKGLLAVPVVDSAGRIRGLVLATQLVSELQEEGYEDAQKMFGAGSDEHATSSAGFAIRKRLPWMQVNLVTAFLAAAVVGAFDSVIAQLTILAAFLPVVAGQGGNAGAQALAVMLRSLALQEIDPRRPRKYLVKEAAIGLLNGFTTGVVAGLVAALVSSNLALGVVIAVAMTFNLVVAGVSGAAIPLVMERLGQDPAQSSNIILTTITDVVGFASFLGLAMLARPWLLA